jgi:hypothetical protein
MQPAATETPTKTFPGDVSQQDTSSATRGLDASTTSSSNLQPSGATDGASYASVKSGVIGNPPPEQDTSADTYPAESPFADYAQYAQYLDRPDTPDQHNQYGSRVAIAGGAAAMGAKAHDARRPEDPALSSSQYSASQYSSPEQHGGVAHVESTTFVFH